MENLFIHFFGLLALAGSVATVVSRHPINAALNLVVTFLAVASLYAILQAHLLAAIQIIVYVGAIMLFIVFTILLMDIRDEDLAGSWSLARLAAMLLAVAWGVAVTLRVSGLPPTDSTAELPADFGTAAGLSRQLFTEHLLTVELVSMLLLAGIVGALVLAMRGRTQSTAREGSGS